MSRGDSVESVEPTPLQKQMVRDTLREILQSPQFSKSKRYPALLESIVTHTLAGEFDSLKERNLAAEVFDRPTDYDPSADAIVRTMAGEVRRRMAVYFSEHPEAPARIDLPLGSYVAEFRFPPPGAKATLSARQNAALPGVFAAEILQAPPPQIEKPAPRTHRKFAITAVALVLLAVTGLAVWDRSQNARAQSFWWPVLHNDAPAVVFVGGDPDPQTAPGTRNERAPDTLPRDSNKLTLGNTIATAKVCDAFRTFGRECQITAARVATSQAVRNNTAILIGAFDNPLTDQFLSTARYQFRAIPPEAPPLGGARIGKIVDTSNPNGNSSWTAGPGAEPAANGVDYALLARFHSDINDGYVVVIAGLSAAGTESAAEYASSSENMREVLPRAPKNWGGLNFEAVLQINLAGRSPGGVSVVATQFW
jgi:hypothetical protein